MDKMYRVKQEQSVIRTVISDGTSCLMEWHQVDL